jgi:hypothetical protein
LRLRPSPRAKRLDDFAAEQNREMITFSEDRETYWHTETANDVGNSIGVTV